MGEVEGERRIGGRSNNPEEFPHFSNVKNPRSEGFFSGFFIEFKEEETVMIWM